MNHRSCFIRVAVSWQEKFGKVLSFDDMKDMLVRNVPEVEDIKPPRAIVVASAVAILPKCCWRSRVRPCWRSS